MKKIISPLFIILFSLTAYTQKQFYGKVIFNHTTDNTNPFTRYSKTTIYYNGDSVKYNYTLRNDLTYKIYCPVIEIQHTNSVFFKYNNKPCLYKAEIKLDTNITECKIKLIGDTITIENIKCTKYEIVLVMKTGKLSVKAQKCFSEMFTAQTMALNTIEILNKV